MSPGIISNALTCRRPRCDISSAPASAPSIPSQCLFICRVSPTNRHHQGRLAWVIRRCYAASMRNGVIHSLLLVAVLLAGFGGPAMAYDAALIPDDAHCYSSPADHSQPGSGGEAVHHHHCPAGVVAEDAAVTVSGPMTGGLHQPHPASVLTSYTTAPPTQPPAA